MVQAKKAQIVNVLGGYVGGSILKSAVNHVAPVFWMLPGEDPLTVKPGGTMFFLRTGNGTFAVTANNVFQAYLRANRSFAGVESRIGHIAFSPEERLIDASEELNIATFKMSPDELWKVGKIGLSQWPPVVPETGSGVLLVGFRGLDGYTAGSLESSFGTCAVVGGATDLIGRDITCESEKEYWIKGPTLTSPPGAYDSVSFSGAPLFILIDRSGLFQLALGGVTYSTDPGAGVFMASMADRILPDGTLQK